MNKKLGIEFLQPYIDFLLQRIKFLYGFDTTVLEERLKNNVVDVEIVPASKIGTKTYMEYHSGEKKIYMNEGVLGKYEDGSYAYKYDEVSDFFKHTMIHELLHVASSREGANGIIPASFAGYRKELNEGITQMIADDICGYYENKFLYSYNFPKQIASILRACKGNDAVVGSYFFDELAIGKSIKQGATLDCFENYLYVSLCYHRHSEGQERVKREDNRLKMVVLNVIMPKYNETPPEKREEFLSKLIYIMSPDEEIKTKVIEYLHQYMNLNVSESVFESNKTLGEFGNIQIAHDAFVELPKVDQFLIRDNGTILTVEEPNVEITNREEKEQIYARLFDLNGYDKELTPEIVDQYVELVKAGKYITIHQDSILKRRIIFCGLKRALEERNIFLINDYEEFDKSISVQAKYINVLLEFEDYRKVCENFSICKTKVGKNEFKYSIIFNSTKNEVEEPDLIRVAFFALNWLNSVQSQGADGIDYAYGEKNKAAFMHVRDHLTNYFANNSSFNIDEAAKGSKLPEVIMKLGENPTKMEWLVNYFTYISGRSIPKERKGLSVEEINNPDYHAIRAIEEARDIMLSH